MTLMTRFLDKIMLDDFCNCWEWIGYKSKKGYGMFRKHDETVNTMVYAHRFSYESFVGELLPDMEIDHLCKNRGCVNPKHLEQVTRLENMRRSDAHLVHSNKTHCPQGHPYAGENLYLYKGYRACRICRNAASRRKRAKNRS